VDDGSIFQEIEHGLCSGKFRRIVASYLPPSISGKSKIINCPYA
jgi:hypothetical protein